MKDTEFINKYFTDNTELTNDKKFNSRVEKLSKYVEYLKLLQRQDIYFIFQDLIKYEVACKSKLLDRVKKHKLLYSFNVLMAEGLIEKVEPTEHFEDEYKDYFGEYNFMKMTFYGLTEKGKDLIKTNGVKKYLEVQE